MKFLTARPILCGAIMSLAALLLREVAAPAGPPAKQESARLKYGRAYVQLAKLRLQIAQSGGPLFPNTQQITILQEDANLSDIWLREAEGREAGKPYNVALETALTLSKAADAQYAEAVKHQGTPAFPPAQLEVLKMKAEIARLRVASAKELDLTSPAALVQFELDRLREEIMQLKEQSVRIVETN